MWCATCALIRRRFYILRPALPLLGHDLARCLSTRGKHGLEKPLRCGLVAALPQQDIEFITVLIDGAP